LFFLDYLAAGKIEAGVAAQIVSGMARGCLTNGCALIGGETAEMPGMYADGEYDIAGTIVGIVEKKRILNGSRVKAGDILLSLPSTGLHTNGYSLARKLLFDVGKLTLDSLLPGTQSVLADVLLQVHRSYLKSIALLMKKDLLSAAAHITGGGITDNLPRALPKGLAATIETKSWRVPQLFDILKSLGDVPDADWRRTFNLGAGMILVIPKKKSDAAQRTLRRAGETPWIIGEVVLQKRGGTRVKYV
jgi:phosphoribosylformylglycinamidine cyclo-ligase